MLSKRIIPCLDVKNGKVVKGIKFQNHQIIGDIVELAQYYSQSGADELVFYDITASCDDRLVDISWINKVAREINIPFCVAGGIKTLKHAEKILNAGADKISINSPAIDNPQFINDLVMQFGQQCVVIGIDSFFENENYYVYKYTGDTQKITSAKRLTKLWVEEVQARGAGEIVLNCMNQDGVRQGYDIAQLQMIRELTTIPLIASGGAGSMEHFSQVFQQAKVDGALAAGVFHKRIIDIHILKTFLQEDTIQVRL